MTEQQRPLTHLSDEDLQKILDEANAESEKRKTERQFDFFKPDTREDYFFFCPRNQKAVRYTHIEDFEDRIIRSFFTVRRTKVAAEKDGELWKLTKKIERRIAELNREQAWVCDWGDASQTKSFFWVNHEKIAIENMRSRQYQSNPTRHYMHKETAKKILTEFTEAELRAFVTQEWLPQ